MDWHNRDVVMKNLASLYLSRNNWDAAKVCCHLNPWVSRFERETLAGYRLWGFRGKGACVPDLQAVVQAVHRS